MSYEIQFLKIARKELSALPANIRRRILDRINGLATEPLPSGVKKLQGEPAKFRIRVGDYRVVYFIRNETLVVLIVRVAHRREAYD